MAAGSGSRHAAVFLLSLLCGSEVPTQAAAAAAHRTVVIENMQFTPATIRLRIGDTVAWVNRDLVPHTVTATAFDSKAIAPSGTWSFTASKAGRFDYACSFHPTMKGVVAVE